MAKYKIDLETATLDFDRFCEFARLDLDDDNDVDDSVTGKKETLIVALDDGYTEQKKELKNMCNRMIRDIQKGLITVDDQGHPSVHVQSDSDPVITFKFRPSGLTMAAMDNVGKNKDASKIAYAIAAITQIAPKKILALDFKDLEVLQRVFALFLAN